MSSQNWRRLRHRDDEAMEVDFGFDKIDVEVQDRIDDMVLRRQGLFDLGSWRVTTSAQGR